MHDTSSTTTTVRLFGEDKANLDKIIESIPLATPHGIACAAIRIGLRVLSEDPPKAAAELLRMRKSQGGVR